MGFSTNFFVNFFKVVAEEQAANEEQAAEENPETPEVNSAPEAPEE